MSYTEEINYHVSPNGMVLLTAKITDEQGPKTSCSHLAFI